MNLDKLIESLNDEELSYLRGKLNSLMSKKTTVTSFIESHKHEMSTWLIKCLKSATIKTGSRISGEMYDFAKLFSGKYSGQLWTVGTIPETALEITEIELLFKYWKQIIQETINAAPDKQKEINNFLSLCDIGISTILPKCKDPYENKEINEYWLSQYEALKIFVAAFGRHIPETSTAEPPKEDNGQFDKCEYLKKYTQYNY